MIDRAFSPWVQSLATKGNQTVLEVANDFTDGVILGKILKNFALVAQLVEHFLDVEGVSGSSPDGRTE